MRLYKYILIAVAVVFGLASCSKEAETDRPESQRKLKIGIYDSGVSSANKTRATTDENYQTTFSDGDQVGLYAIKEGAIVGGVDNIALIYTEGTWILGTEISYDEVLKGATYYAYYPYDASAVIDPTNQDPFADMADNWTIASDISDADTFSQNDLMTGSGSADLGLGSYTLSIEMRHRMGMVVITLPYVVYKFTNTNPVLENYTVPVAEQRFGVSLNGTPSESVIPYLDSKTDKYRILVKPGTKCAVTGGFKSDDGAKKYSIPFDTGITAGLYEPYTVDGVSEKNFELKIGDFYCADGSLISYVGGGAAPTDAIGVVYYVGNAQPSTLYPEHAESPDVLKSDYPKCTHGLVIALNNSQTGSSRFATAKTTSFSAWATAFAADQYIIPGAADNLPSHKQILGYNNTKIIKATSKSPDAAYSAVVSVCAEQLESYIAAVTTPTATTGWYLPSLLELKVLIYDDINTINQSIQQVGGGEITAVSGGYYASNERNLTNIFWVSMGGGTAAFTDRTKSSSVGYFRFALAF